DVCEDGGKENVAHHIVEYEQVLEEIRDEDASKNAPFVCVECHTISVCTPNRPERNDEERKVRQKPEKSCRYEPVKDDVVHAVKPLLCSIHIRVVVFVEHD